VYFYSLEHGRGTLYRSNWKRMGIQLLINALKISSCSFVELNKARGLPRTTICLNSRHAFVFRPLFPNNSTFENHINLAIAQGSEMAIDWTRDDWRSYARRFTRVPSSANLVEETDQYHNNYYVSHIFSAVVLGYSIEHL
jgi:hypothetical protein